MTTAPARAALLACLLALLGHAASVTGPDDRLQCDLPASLQMRNVGGSDGAGLCVFTSIEHAARWQGVTQLIGFREWMRKRPGGGYPQKVDAMVAAYCKSRGAAVPEYLNVEGDNPEVLVAACATGRMPAVTYGWSPTRRYGGQLIDHMVNLFAARADDFVVLDNNYPATAANDKVYEHLSAPEWRQAHTRKGTRRGWYIVFLQNAPPPPPTN